MSLLMYVRVSAVRPWRIHTSVASHPCSSALISCPHANAKANTDRCRLSTMHAHIRSCPSRQSLAGSRRRRGAAVDVPRPADVAAKGRSSCDTSYTGQARTASVQTAPCCASRQGTTSHAWVLACLSFSRLGSSSRTLCSMVSRATVSSSACVASMP